MLFIEHPPKLVYDDSGRLIEVILSAEDYLVYLRTVAAEVDWEMMPAHLQDAVDQLMIEAVRSEKETAFDLDSVLSDPID